ncbi:hypothetical protein ACN9MZ_01855 [Pseudoduganella sp. S-14]|jgi:hypothetical protein|uniref:hypothetical protein n=1 Tax=Pseudoduganella sp. S-14 TaxID=3404065 RepID=UPI003CF51C45
MNKFFGYALVVSMFSVGTSWINFIKEPSSSSGGRGSSWSSSSGSWGGGGGGHK